MQLIAELKRRKVVRVAVVYAATAFAVLQGADIMLPNLGVPDWTMRFLTALVLLGFPIALVMAWALELKPDGSIQRTAPSSEPRTNTPLLGRRAIIASTLLIVLGIGLSAGWLLKPSDTAPNEEIVQHDDPSTIDPSIAVLPFVNMSGNADNEYFSDGLTETLLHQLAQVPDLKVAARTSSFEFKDRNEDIRTIADTLGVAHILEGSVQRAGNRVRITAQLIQADDGYHLWSEVFDRDLDDIFAVQDDIAGQVAAALRGSLLAETLTTSDGGTESAEAYDWYLRGRSALYDRNAERLDDAVRAMRRAIALDPEFAQAWAGLSEALEEQAVFTGADRQPLEAGNPGEVVEAARTAVRLAPANPWVRVRLGLVLMNQTGDLSGAREQLDEALSIDPENAQALVAMSVLRWNQSRVDEALEYAERAMELDPLDWMLKVESVNKYMAVGDIEGAERLARQIVEHDPDFVPGLQALGNVYWRTGRHVDAFRIYHRLLEINPKTAYIMERIAASFAALGDLDGSMRWLDRAARINAESVEIDRAELLRLQGQIEQAGAIYEGVIERERSNGGSSEARRLWLESDLAMLRSDWTGMYAVASERLASIESGETAVTAQWLFDWARTDLALAADRTGRIQERDHLLALIDAHLNERDANGSDNQYLWRERAAVHALRGDADKAATALERAFESGYRRRVETIHDPMFASVIDAPVVQAVLDAMAERNRVDLERLKALESELGDFEAST